ncbi:transcription factor bHLH113-like [Aristolochia californica]|uniref:transcription factor bHLH113-like n=1 Tax=Aristolochia californica TaxID=171875 RepID=UPI0035DABEF4
MATREDFAGDGGFVQLLESGDLGFEMAEDFMYTSSFSAEDPHSLLSFGHGRSGNEMVLPETGVAPQKSGVTGSDSSSTSSSSGRSFSQLRKREKGDDGKVEQKRRCASEAATVSVSGTISECRKTNKKPKSEPPKVRKEKIGERITALQQLVSPFGKTDTASVLHEATGYIRFLHEQVQVLSSPYLQRLPSSGLLPGAGNDDEHRYELRSRGLCLVPVASTVNVANSNGADFWSPAMGSHSSNS